MTIPDRVAEVRGRIKQAAVSGGRDASDVRLIAVSKTWSPEAVRAAAEAGVTDFGENKAQELAHKLAAVGDLGTWHFVGALQTNKARSVVGKVALIHSVDRIEVAEAISRRAERSGLSQPVLVQVNVAREPGKHGIDPDEAVDFAEGIAALEGVELRGLMTLPPFGRDPESSRPWFKKLADLGAVLRDGLPGATELSMGMSRDFEIAVQEGATMVRVGEAVFGARAPHDRDGPPKG
ncbi:MAG: YggS family pyridoxal phosphate-dependent enzyme [Actinomycetota bacterium]|nr:YggS family pyridoxal phosphate-dependent enzyme [Actinomycetota bacterium]